MEEEDQVVLKHVCKFCSKSFPCGRSLGGHMRSHITNNTSASATETEEKLTTTTTTTRKPSSLNNNGGSSSKVGEYDLRENPKKTWRFADSRSEETSLVTEDKFCKECGKAFHSWKALFGHMKCHSEKERASVNIEDQDSSSHKIVTDSQSDNEATANPNRRRRSKRRTRYMTVASTSSLSFANHPSSSVSEVEQEQEEVAMSLMMLSRDVGHWGGFNFNSLAESSDNNSAYFRTNLSTKTEREKVKSKGKKKPEIPNGFKTTKPKVSINGFVKNCKEKKQELDFQSALDDSEDEEGKNDSEQKSNYKRGKFKCTTCSKIFHSYQALGGHRASHKKMKGCSGSRNESSENSIETDLNNGYLVQQHDDLIDNEEETTITQAKKNKGHECPICLKVFSSGQALGGHKRSHLGGGSVILEEPPVEEIRDFLDLNLPAATEEESNSHGENYRPWWVVEGNSHKQEAPLLGLISN